jgi:hypothetical protein
MMAIYDIWYIHDIVYSYTVNDVNGFYKAIIVTGGGHIGTIPKEPRILG